MANRILCCCLFCGSHDLLEGLTWLNIMYSGSGLIQQRIQCRNSRKKMYGWMLKRSGTDFQVFLRRELHGHNFLCSCEWSRHVQDVSLARETHEYYSPEFFQEVGHTGTFLPSGQPGNWNSEPRRDTKAYIINLDDYFKIANILVHPWPTASNILNQWQLFRSSVLSLARSHCCGSRHSPRISKDWVKQTCPVSILPEIRLPLLNVVFALMYGSL